MRSWLFALVLGAAFAGGCVDRPSSSQCDKLLDHMAKLEMEAGGTDGLSDEQSADLEKQEKEIKAELAKEGFKEQCEKRTPPSVVNCIMKKRSMDQVGTCDKG